MCDRCFLCAHFVGKSEASVFINVMLIKQACSSPVYVDRFRYL